MRFFIRSLSVSLCVFAISSVLEAEPHAKIYKTDSEWPGVQMQVFEVKRVASDRVVILVRLEATSKAPATTLIGISSPKLKGGKDGGTPQPFSLAASTLTDEQTEKKYPVAAPDPLAIAYAPTEIMTQLAKGQAVALSVEFQLPAPEKKDEKVPKQTVTLKLQNATSTIAHVVIPALPSQEE